LPSPFVWLAFGRSTLRSIATLITLTVLALAASAQNQAPAAPPTNAATSAPFTSDLDRLQQAASQANVDISHMRIEKWKTDPASKQQAQANADSLQRNLTTALPGLIDGFRAAPQDLNAGFKLYRNLTALYDVFASFTESTGAFGPKNDYDALVRQLNVIDSVRHDLGDNLENLTSAKEAEVKQLQTRVQNLQQAAAAAAATPPKKVIVDDTQPPKKAVHKKKPATTDNASGSGSSSTSGTSGGTTPSSTKAQ
jgi:hypothetical protein